MLGVMLLIIDNYDSFVHNLARYCVLAGWEEQIIKRNDEITINDIKNIAPAAIILSPGPKTPQDAGICIEVIKTFGADTPILGVCLGHQAIGEAYGYTTIKAKEPLHGQSSSIRHNSRGVFTGISKPLDVGRYHSLVIDPAQTGPLEVTATSDKGEIMAVQHKSHPVYGVQFHPESVLTQHGLQLIQNFKTITENRQKNDTHYLAQRAV